MANSIKRATKTPEFKNARTRAIEVRNQHGDPRKDFWVRDDFDVSKNSRHTPVFGFSIKVTAADNVSYTLDWTHHPSGKPKRTKIGNAHEMDIETAHNAARKLKVNIGEGIYPSSKPQVAEAQTVADVMEFYLQYRFKNQKPTAGNGARHVIRSHIIPAIGDRSVTSLKTSDVTVMLLDIEAESGANTKGAALSYFKAAWRYTKANGNLDVENPAADITPPERESPKAVKARIEKQVIKPEHRPLINKALDDLEAKGTRNPFIIMCLRMMLYAGDRKREITDIRLKDIDLENGVIRIPDNKTNDTAKTIVIVRQVKDIITAALKKRYRLNISENQSPFLFVAQTCGKRKRVKPNSVYNAVASVWNEVRDTDPRLANTTPGKTRHGRITTMKNMDFTNEEMASVTQHADPKIFDKHYAFENREKIVARNQLVADTIEQQGKYQQVDN